MLMARLELGQAWIRLTRIKKNILIENLPSSPTNEDLLISSSISTDMSINLFFRATPNIFNWLSMSCRTVNSIFSCQNFTIRKSQMWDFYFRHYFWIGNDFCFLEISTYELDFPCVDFAQIQNIVDEHQQVRAGILNRVQVSFLFFVQMSIGE